MKSIGPKITTNGLELYFDAMDAGCYPGEPTINYVPNPTDISTWTANSSLTVTTDVIGLDFASSSYKLTDAVASLSNAQSSTFGGTTLSTSTQYTMSVWFKMDPSSTSRAIIRIADSSNFLGLRLRTDLGTVSSQSNTMGASSLSSGIAATITHKGETWKLGYLTFTTPASFSGSASALYCQIFPAHDDTSDVGAGSNQGSITIWGPQIEEGSYPTPFVNGTRSATSLLTDLSGNGNIGDFDNDLGTGVAHFRYGGLILPASTAYWDFNGTNQQIDVTPVTDNRNFTIEGWIKPDTTSITQSWYGDDTYYRCYSDSSAKAKAWVREDGSGTLFYLTSTTSLSTSEWNYISITAESQNEIKIYFNGVLEDTEASAVEFLDGSDNTAIGNGYDGHSTYFDGKIAIIRHYSRVLSATEILANYNAQKSRFGH